METTFLEKDLPFNDLEKVGLYQNDQLMLVKEDLEALLSGRRTDLISLKNLQADGFVIDKLDAKLSLKVSAEGKLELKAHPIYKEVQHHPLLTEHEAAILADDSVTSISKTYHNPPDKSKTYIIEYDQETKEFISYEPENVQAPDKVNGESLTEKQKEDFKNGNAVSLSDGTTFQHRASERKGIVADRKALVFSLLLDGGISYFLIRGIRNLIGASPQKEAFTNGYQQAVREMEENQRKVGANSNLAERNDFSEQHSRGYGRRSSR